MWWNCGRLIMDCGGFSQGLWWGCSEGTNMSLEPFSLSFSAGLLLFSSHVHLGTESLRPGGVFRGSGDTTCVEDFISGSRWQRRQRRTYLLQRRSHAALRHMWDRLSIPRCSSKLSLPILIDTGSVLSRFPGNSEGKYGHNTARATTNTYFCQKLSLSLKKQAKVCWKVPVRIVTVTWFYPLNCTLVHYITS